jgi:hypothetical protein
MTQREIIIGSHCFLCDFALYGYMYHPSCCDCLCFCEVGIGVTFLLNAIIYKNEFELIKILHLFCNLDICNACV